MSLRVCAYPPYRSKEMEDRARFREIQCQLDRVERKLDFVVASLCSGPRVIVRATGTDSAEPLRDGER